MAISDENSIYNNKNAYNYVNPFVHALSNDEFDWYDLIKTYVLTIILLPFRIITICLLLLLAWLLTCIGLYGITPEELQAKPISGWRKVIKYIAAASMRLLFVAATFNFVRYKGSKASAKQAPILVVAPHSSYVDAITAVVLGPPSICAKEETRKLPIFGSEQAPRKEAAILVVAPHSSFLDICIVYVTNLCSVIVRLESMDSFAGKLIDYSQPIYVLREDPSSRHNTIQKIIERSKSNEDWPQILIFPEGTCTNRSALITFKPGAFYPGVPVQPVLLRYPNKHDTFTWTWEGPGVLKLLWLTLTEFHNHCEIEFLPVYIPNGDEKTDPKLFAKNVRDVMAKALGVPTSDFTYDDCKIMSKAKSLRIPFSADIVEITRLCSILRWNCLQIEDIVDSNFATAIKNPSTLEEFSKTMKVSKSSNEIQQLFSILDTEKNNRIYMKLFFLCLIFINNQNDTLANYLCKISKIYTYNENSKQITRRSLYDLLQHTGNKFSQDECDNLFIKIDSSNLGTITFDDFVSYITENPKYAYLFKIIMEKSK